MVKRPIQQQPFVTAELMAAEALGLRLTEEYVRLVRNKLREKAHRVEGSVQYYALFADSEWTPEELDDRIFGAVRLLYEYTGPSSNNGVPNLENRIAELKKLVLRLADEKGSPELPIVHKIRNDEIPRPSARFSLRAG